MEELYYTVDETAKLLKSNRNKVYDLIRTGHLKATKLGRIKVPEFELKRFARDNLGKDLSDLTNVVDLDIGVIGTE